MYNNSVAGDLLAIQEHRENLALQYNFQHRTVVLNRDDDGFFIYDSYLHQLRLIKLRENILLRENFAFFGVADICSSVTALRTSRSNALLVFNAYDETIADVQLPEPCDFILIIYNHGKYGICCIQKTGKAFYIDSARKRKTFWFRNQITKINRTNSYAAIHYRDFSVDLIIVNTAQELLERAPILKLDGIYEAVPGSFSVQIWAVPCSRDSVISVIGSEQNVIKVEDSIAKILQCWRDSLLVFHDNGKKTRINKKGKVAEFDEGKHAVYSFGLLHEGIYEDMHGLYWRGASLLKRMQNIEMSLLFSALPELVLDEEIRKSIEQTFRNEYRIKSKNPISAPSLVDIVCVDTRSYMQRIFRVMKNADGRSKRAELAEVWKLGEGICAADMLAEAQITLNGIFKVFCGGVRAYFLFADGRAKQTCFVQPDKQLEFEDLQVRFADEIRFPKHIHVLTDTAQDKHDVLLVTQRNGETLIGDSDSDFFGEDIKTAFNRRQTNVQQYVLRQAGLLYNTWGFFAIIALAQDANGKLHLKAFWDEDREDDQFEFPQVESPIMLYYFKNYFAVVQAKRKIQFFMFKDDGTLAKPPDSNIKPPLAMTQFKHYWCDSAVLRTRDGFYMQPQMRYPRTADQVDWNYNHLQYVDFGRGYRLDDTTAPPKFEKIRIERSNSRVKLVFLANRRMFALTRNGQILEL